MRCFLRFVAAGALLIALEPAHATGMVQLNPPIDPFDYSYCGGKPVYPIIGFNFATYCGPRNQIALGRRGKLMWSFAAADGASIAHRGARQLSEDELSRLTLLAEVAQLAEVPEFRPNPVVYDLGIDFQGRPYKRVRGTLASRGSSANALFEAMRALVPDQPLLPACPGAPADFSPTQLPSDRHAAR
jgi:hypothetical protein